MQSRLPFLPAATLTLPAALALLVAPTAPAQSRLYDITSPLTGFGSGVVGLGDLDADGYADFAAAGGGQVIAYSGRTAAVLYQKVVGPTGGALAAVGDQDADGFDDFLLAAPDDPTVATDAGAVHLVSGKTGTKLKTWSGGGAGHRYGSAAALVGDVDKDGFADFGFGASGYPSNNWGALYIVSGKDRTTVLQTYLGTMAGERVGSGVGSFGDVDNDGYADFIYGAAGEYPNVASFARIVSGRFKIVLKTIIDTTSAGTGDNSIGQTNAKVGDVDGDGTADYFVGGPGRSTGVGEVYSGKTMNRLLVTVPEYAAWATAAAGLGDINGDGRADFAVGGSGGRNGGIFAPFVGVVRFYSGNTGAQLAEMWGEVGSEQLGAAVALAGDVDRDGRPDLMIGRPGRNRFTVTSTRDLLLWCDRHTLPISTGGSAVYRLQAGAAHANKYAFVVGSASGTSPGISIGGLSLPLNFDAYLQFTGSNPNSPLLPTSLLTLDANGNGSCNFNIVPGLSPIWIGVTLWHAYLVLGLNLSSFDLASNARPVRLVP